jgi:3-hydroxyisobutyrate dehydrogenase
MEALKWDGLALETWNPMVQGTGQLLYSIVHKDKEKNMVRSNFWSQSTRDVTNLRHGNYHVINDAAVKEVFESENGLLSQDNPGKLIINMVPFLLKLLAI